MTAGLPGVGIGGLFYLLLVLLMPLYEFWRMLQGRSSIARLKHVAVHWALAGGIVGALAATGWALRSGFDALISAGALSPQLRQVARDATMVSPTNALLTAGVVLLGVVGGMALLSLIVDAKPRSPPP